MMAFNCVWLFFFGLYLEQVMPKTFGRRRHPCFFLKPSFYGCCKNSGNKIKVGASNKPGQFDSVAETMKFETSGMNPLCYEMLTAEMDEKE